MSSARRIVNCSWRFQPEPLGCRSAPGSRFFGNFATLRSIRDDLNHVSLCRIEPRQIIEQRGSCIRLPTATRRRPAPQYPSSATSTSNKPSVKSTIRSFAERRLGWQN
jgi:hypothetical protein